MNQILNLLGPDVTGKVVEAVVALVGLMLTWMFNSLRKKFESEKADMVLLTLQQAAKIAVHDVEQRLVPTFKECAEDGKLSEKDMKELKQEALDIVLGYLGKNVKREVAEAAVEHAVYQMNDYRDSVQKD